ncbi:MAG: response regulator [Actinobacteria bacterium]|nr:response regulator [Actinomycetota bacterium]
MTQVLIVDDDPAVRQLVETLLTLERSWIVETAASGEDARAWLDDEDRPIPDLVVLDVMMPGLDGFQVLSWLREHELLYDILVVMLTARTTFEDEAQGWERGCDAYVRKPFDANELLDVLDIVLDAGPDLRVARRHKRLEELLVQS